MQVEIEKLIFGGQGLARLNGKVVFVWGALPGEIVTIQIIKNKKDYAEAIVEKVIKAAPERQNNIEEHYLSCSPWQILDAQLESAWKVKLSQEAYYQLRQYYNLDSITIENEFTKQLGYRNKIEYSFWQNADKLDLAFFKRGSHKRVAIQTCLLADQAINQTAKQILAWLRDNKISGYNLKSLIILSNTKAETIAALFLKDKININFYPELNNNLLGFQLYYSNPKSPAAVPTELIYQAGQQAISSVILNTPLEHGLLGFFQVNIPMFEKALMEISQWLNASDQVIDYYSGVGAISLPLANKVDSLLLIENNSEAANFAAKNINNLKLTDKCQIHCLAAENMLDCITANKVIIVDPPRTGLHQAIIDRLLEIKPKRIIYLSCNLSTQARDIQKLLNEYTIRHISLYNFFPKTPHIEGLCVIDHNTS